jgi:site-specific DNA-methyltransferase (adenine-specific)
MSTPYYSDEFVTLYHGDCREIATWLQADVLVFDPPYGRGWRQGQLNNLNRRTRPDNRHEGIAGDLDSSLRDEVLLLWGDRRCVAFGDLMMPPPPRTRQVGVYRKPPDAGVRGTTAGRRRDLEAVYLIGPWPSGIGGRSSLFTTAAPVQGTDHGVSARYGHPHAKPVDVMADLIRLANDAAVIADPTCGAGSTLVAAKGLGLRAIGVELEEEFCERAAQRLSVPDLFSDGAA